MCDCAKAVPRAGHRTAEAGAEVLVVPAPWLAGPHKEDHRRTLTHARAIETTSDVAAAGQGGTHYVGESSVIDPMGADLSAALGRDDGIVTAVGSRQRVLEVRQINPTSANRSGPRRNEALP